MPFVQVAPDLRTRLRRSTQLVPMLAGMVIGGLLLSSICYGLAQFVGALNVIEWRREIAIFVGLVLISGDIVAIYNNALYPLSFNRQT